MESGRGSTASYGHPEYDDSTMGEIASMQHGKFEIAARWLSTRTLRRCSRVPPDPSSATPLNKRGTAVVGCEWPASLIARQDP